MLPFGQFPYFSAIYSVVEIFFYCAQIWEIYCSNLSQRPNIFQHISLNILSGTIFQRGIESRKSEDNLLTFQDFSLFYICVYFYLHTHMHRYVCVCVCVCCCVCVTHKRCFLYSVKIWCVYSIIFFAIHISVGPILKVFLLERYSCSS